MNDHQSETDKTAQGPCANPACACGPNCRCGEACVCTPESNCVD